MCDYGWFMSAIYDWFHIDWFGFILRGSLGGKNQLEGRNNLVE